MNGGIIEFKVERSWLSESDIDKKNVVLQRYVSDAWEDLPTEVEKETSSYMQYSA